MSALAAFKIVKQNRDQLAASFKPELVLSSVNFTAFKSEVSTSSFAENWVKRGGDKQSSDLGFSPLVLPIKNIGRGAAKKIEYSWGFSIDSTIKDINSRAQEALVPAFFTAEKDYVSIRSEVMGSSTSNWGIQRSGSIDYILSGEQTSSCVYIELPPAYRLLMSALLYFMSVKSNEELSGLPELYLSLKYEDVGENEHEVSFCIDLELVSMCKGAEEFTGFFSITKF